MYRNKDTLIIKKKMIKTRKIKRKKMQFAVQALLGTPTWFLKIQ